MCHRLRTGFPVRLRPRSAIFCGCRICVFSGTDTLPRFPWIFARARGQRLIVAALFLRDPHRRQLLHAEIKDLRAQHRQKRNILLRIVQQRQQRHERVDFNGIKEAIVVVHISRKIVFCQNLVEQIAVVLHAAHQNHNIFLFQTSLFARLAVVNRPPQMVTNDLDRRECLFFGLTQQLELVVRFPVLVPRRLRQIQLRFH